MMHRAVQHIISARDIDADSVTLELSAVQTVYNTVIVNTYAFDDVLRKSTCFLCGVIEGDIRGRRNMIHADSCRGMLLLTRCRELCHK